MHLCPRHRQSLRHPRATERGEQRVGHGRGPAQDGELAPIAFMLPRERPDGVCGLVHEEEEAPLLPA